MMKRKTIVLVMSLVLVLGVAIGGTLAWLTDSTGEVKNTFTTSDVDIELSEPGTDNLQMVPGKTITKDPKVTVVANSEDCYVFVKIDKSENYDTFLDAYIVAEGWTLVEGTTNVYYRIADKSTEAQELKVLHGDAVTVKTTVTKAEMNKLATATYPTLTFTAYAIQKNHLPENSTIAQIWAMAQQ